MPQFRIGISPDFTRSDGEPVWDDPALKEFGLRPDVAVEFITGAGGDLTADQIRPYDAIISWGARYQEGSFEGVDRLALIARLGVGYDTVPVDLCTEKNVLLTVTTGAAGRPVAEAALTLMLAIGHQIGQKERLIRAGRWKERDHFHGVELRDRVVGLIGFGNIGQELFRLLEPFGLRRKLAFDPYAHEADARSLGVEIVPLETLLRESDFVSLNCPLNSATHGLIGAAQLRMMKPTAFLINTARGPIIREADLIEALRNNVIRGAALDVFEQEPIDPDNPLLTMENVLILPHATAWTEELFRDYFQVLIEQLQAVMHGRIPRHLVNQAVEARPGLQRKLAALAECFGS